MKRIIVATALTAMIATSLTSGGAFAQSGPDHRPPAAHGRYEPSLPKHPAQNQRAPQTHYQAPPRLQPQPQPIPRYSPPPHYQAGQHKAGNQQPGPGWRKGTRLPSNHYRRADVVAKPQAHHLPPAPRGHEWVRVNRDAVMVAVGTGLVVYGLQNIFR